MIYDLAKQKWKIKCHWSMPPDAQVEDSQIKFVPFDNGKMVAVCESLSIDIDIQKMVKSREEYQIRADYYKSKSPKFTLDDCFGVSLVPMPDGSIFLFGSRYGVFRYNLGEWVQMNESHRAVMCKDTACIAIDDNNILIAGYIDYGNMYGFMGKCYIYKLSANRFLRVGDMVHKRKNHAACLLPTGEVFVCGGRMAGVTPTDVATTEECEIYNPRTRKWRVLGGSLLRRNHHACMVISPTLVMIVGGQSDYYNSALSVVCEVYDLQTESAVRVSDVPSGQFNPIMIPLYDTHL
jgi:hypothetical protein